MTARVRRPSWLASPPPGVAVEIASDRVTVVQVADSAAGPRISAHASEPLPPGAVTPALSGVNIARPADVGAALERALGQAGLGAARRIALVVPDSLARVTLIPLEQVPARAADLESLVHWHVRKATPFPLEEAQVSHFIASAGPGAGATVAAVVARRDVVHQYEALTAARGMQAGVVDLASLNVMNAVMAAGNPLAGDWLLVHLTAEATTLAILRGGALLFYRHRTAVDEEPLGALVHQTAMYHEDRLGGGAFARVCVSGISGSDEAVPREIGERLRIPVEQVDVRTAAGLSDRVDASPRLLDTLAAPVGVLLRSRVAA